MYVGFILSINQSITFARAPVTDDHWRRTVYYLCLYCSLLTSISCKTVVIRYVFYLLNSRSTADTEEERKLLQCLRKSVMSPYRKRVVCLPSSSVTDSGTSSAAHKIETRSLTSPRNKGLTTKSKPSPHRESASKTRSSPRRSTPRKRVVVKTRMSTPLRKTKHFTADDRKKTGLTPRRTPNKKRTPSKKRSQTPRKSTKRTPAKSMLTIKYQVLISSYMCIK